jgi:hypothetical protein
MVRVLDFSLDFRGLGKNLRARGHAFYPFKKVVILGFKSRWRRRS